MTTERTFNTSDLTDDGRGGEEEGNPLWLIVVDRTQLSMCITGAIVNVMTVITLNKNGAGFQPCVSIVFSTYSCVVIERFYFAFSFSCLSSYSEWLKSHAVRVFLS